MRLAFYVKFRMEFNFQFIGLKPRVQQQDILMHETMAHDYRFENTIDLNSTASQASADMYHHIMEM